MKTLKKLAAVVLLAVTCGGCAYAGVASVGDDKVVITRNDMILFGLLRQVYICEVNQNQLQNCRPVDSPP